MSLAKGLSILFIFSENQLLVSLVFAVFFVSIPFIFTLIIMVSLLSASFEDFFFFSLEFCLFLL